MAVKLALAVGLFIVICVSPGLKASQVVPDGLIYTEAKKTLVQGVQGVLTCRFFGDPSAVYWRKRLNPDELSIMVIWLDGEVSGPRYDDGSCDVDENYSLIIHNVSTADSGRIYCTVSNNKGPLMNNYTDILVVDTAITTNPMVILQLRQATYGILQCTVHIKARRVSWMKGTTSSANESLVVMESNKNVSERSGNGYDDGKYNITQEYSLVIKELQLHHEGLYVCEVTDDTGISFRNHTFVNVVAQPLEPFPTIQECLHTKQHDSNYCILVAESRMTLTCQVVKYYPSINLVFLYGSKVLQPSDTTEWDNTDGTYNKTIRIAPSGNKELYSCVASSVPGTNVNKSTSVLLQGDEPVQSTMVVILVSLSLIITLSLVGCCIRRKRQPKTFSVSYKALVSGIASLQDLQPEAQMDFEAFEQLVNEVLMQRYRRISDFSDEKCTTTANEILTEIRAALCDTHQMLIDWRESQTSTRIKEMIEIKTEPAYAWPSDEELNTISRNLTPDSMKKVCKKLKIDFQCDDVYDEEKRFKTLRKWRTKASAKPLEDKWKQLFSALESNQLKGLLPTLRGPYIYKAELVDLAFHLLIHDLLPITKELGIDATKLVSYRPAFHPSHLESSTINLLIKIYASIRDTSLTKPERLTFCKKIANSKYDSDAITGVFEYNMSYGELCSISEAITQNLEEREDQGATSSMLPGPGIPDPLRILQDVLQLTDQDIADRLDTSHPLTAYALVKIWKEKPRPSVFNYRATLVHELRTIHMTGLADEIAAGKYMKEGTSLVFIEDMVRGLNQDQLDCLRKLLKLSETPSDTISEEICAWVPKWITEKENCRKSRPRKQRVKTGGTLTVPAGGLLARMTKSTMHHDHRDLNDRLVEHGFLDLAREIMIIEQQLVAGVLT